MKVSSSSANGSQSSEVARTLPAPAKHSDVGVGFTASGLFVENTINNNDQLFLSKRVENSFDISSAPDCVRQTVHRSLLNLHNGNKTLVVRINLLF